MIDILKKINQGLITVDEADVIFEEVVNKFHNGELEISIYEYVKFNEYEATADASGIDYGVLAGWRKNGWPTSCSGCGKLINYKKYGWIIDENDELKGLNCC